MGGRGGCCCSLFLAATASRHSPNHTPATLFGRLNTESKLKEWWNDGGMVKIPVICFHSDQNILILCICIPLFTRASVCVVGGGREKERERKRERGQGEKEPPNNSHTYAMQKSSACCLLSWHCSQLLLRIRKSFTLLASLNICVSICLSF